MAFAAVATLSVAGCKKQSTTPPDGLENPDDDLDADDVEADEDEQADDSETAVLDKASFDETIQEHFSEVSDCYVAALETNPDLQGQLNAEFEIDPEGKVVTISALDDSTLNDEGLLTCIQQAASNWQFARPPQGPLTLRYTYNLVPAG